MSQIHTTESPQRIRTSQSPRPSRSNRGRFGLDRDRRGVSEVLGGILMFGLLIALLVLIQVNAVPAENQQIEFEHNQRVEQDMLALDRAILQSGTMDAPGSSEIELAAAYPSRLFLLNPAPGAGTIETTGTGGSISITGANVPSTSNYWNADSGPKTFDTTGIRYRPNYNEYANAPNAVYEHNALVNVFETGAGIPVDPAGFVHGNQITLVAVEGQFSRSGTTGRALETAPISAPATAVTLENNPGEDIVITLSTTLSEDHWEQILEDESVATITDFTTGDPYNELEVTLADGTYELRMARVAVGGSVDTAGLDPHYLAAVDGTQSESVRLGERKALSVQVRDEYNNPVRGNVTFTAADGDPEGDAVFLTESGTLRPQLTVDATDEGIARALFVPEETGTWTVTATIHSGTGRERVDFTVPVRSKLGSPTNNSVSNINPWETVRLDETRQMEKSGKGASLNFSSELGTSARMSEIRVLFYFSNNEQIPSEVVLYNESGAREVRFDVGEGWTDVSGLDIVVPPEGAPDTSVDLGVTDVGNPNFAIMGIAIRYETSDGFVTENYFVQIPSAGGGG